MNRIHAGFILILCCFLMIFTQSCASTFSGIGGVVSPVSSSQEASLGAQINKGILAQYSVLNNSGVQEYINAIGNTLARNSGRTDVPFNFTVLNSSEINAFAAPGGYIYVTSGMLKFLDNESELAAVLSHEIGHVVARHSVKLAQAQLGLNLTFDYAGRLTGVNTRKILPQIVQAIIVQKFSREEEAEADRLGTTIMAKAGYSPQGMVQLLESLNTLESRNILTSFIANHPSSVARVADVQQYIVANNLNIPGLIIDRPIFHEIIGSF